MRASRVVFGCVCWILGVAVVISAGHAEEWQRLFDGATLAGWEAAGAPESFRVEEGAIAAGVDVFLTGEISEPQAHLAQETGVAFLACGHHATERWGAPAVAEHLAQRLGLEHVFIDIPNPA